ncbi:uncharacterized protein LOC119100361 [Pollicipes pollicipes]|uniref:uncharacterized protein LOC119100361 n=1 Tax=Pollicipes pollicipes TaxID=41117 RepID=UPI0018853C92|nr:uncharacterized protein LOC119100361 [Pollicipes pollicipes]
MKQGHRDRWLQPLNDTLCSHAEEERLVGPALLLCALAGAAVAQVTDRPTTTTTPVPILKQVNRVNDDGSYTYGFEAADGSFKLETRDVNGEVTGKYGYVDANGQQQVFEYNANKGCRLQPELEPDPAARHRACLRPLPARWRPAPSSATLTSRSTATARTWTRTASLTRSRPGCSGRFFRPVQGFDARGVVNGFQPVPLNG